MTDSSINDIDFEYWSDLASTDPQKFEEMRQDEILALIESASNPRLQQRLRGLQWKIDQIREQHKDSPMASCLAISELMWITFERLSKILQFQAENGLLAPIPTPEIEANIIPFPARSEA